MIVTVEQPELRLGEIHIVALGSAHCKEQLTGEIPDFDFGALVPHQHRTFEVERFLRHEAISREDSRADIGRSGFANRSAAVVEAEFYVRHAVFEEEDRKRVPLRRSEMV